jgi:hypothetical protein
LKERTGAKRERLLARSLTKWNPSKERITKPFGNPNHPVCAAAVAAHLFLDGAATPLEEVAVSDRFHSHEFLPLLLEFGITNVILGAPVSGGELPASHPFTRPLWIS